MTSIETVLITGDGILVLRVAGVTKWDASNARELRAAATELVHNWRIVVVDMTSVTAMDSTGLGSLVGVLKALPPGGAVRLCGVNPPVKRLIDLSRLQRVFPSYASIDAAVAA